MPGLIIQCVKDAGIKGIELTYLDGTIRCFDSVRNDTISYSKDRIGFAHNTIHFELVKYSELTKIREYKLCPTRGWEDNGKCRCNGGLEELTFTEVENRSGE